MAMALAPSVVLFRVVRGTDLHENYWDMLDLAYGIGARYRWDGSGGVVLRAMATPSLECHFHVETVLYPAVPASCRSLASGW